MLRTTLIFLTLALTGCTTSTLPDDCAPVYLSSETPVITNGDLSALSEEKRVKVFKSIKYLHLWGEDNFHRIKTICGTVNND